MVTPGIIDIHSYERLPSSGVSTSSDGNEATSPVADVWAEHSPGFKILSMLFCFKRRDNFFHFARIGKFDWW